MVSTLDSESSDPSSNLGGTQTNIFFLEGFINLKIQKWFVASQLRKAKDKIRSTHLKELSLQSTVPWQIDENRNKDELVSISIFELTLNEKNKSM